MSTISVSPLDMRRSVEGFTVVAANGAWKSLVGSGDACGTPLRVMKAKLTGSGPAWFRQSWFCTVLST